MEWIRPIDKLPSDGEAVLVKKRENTELAHYDAEGKRFILGNGGEYPITDDISWMELLRPNENIV
jgi:hypothetical protein